MWNPVALRPTTQSRRRGRLNAPAVEVLELRTLLANGITPTAGPALSGTAGIALVNVTVASFTVVGPAGSPGSQWRANINWGDGIEDKMVVPVQDSTTAFHFAGTHNYNAAGTYTITVMIAVPGSGMPNSNTVSTTAKIAAGAPSPIPPGDYDGDHKTDLAVFRPSTDTWYVALSGGGGKTVQFGDPAHADVSVPGDYEGNNQTDFAVFRPSTDQWFIRLTNGQTYSTQFGDPSQHDIPVPADYEGIGKTDLAVFRPSTGQWIIRLSSGQTFVTQFGDPSKGDIPVPADYEGIGKVDLAVFRPSTDQWIIAASGGGGAAVYQFGDPSQHDEPVPGDYNGDGRADLAVFRPSTAHWIISASGGGKNTQFGDPASGDRPAGLPVGAFGSYATFAIRGVEAVSPLLSLALAPGTTLDDSAFGNGSGLLTRRLADRIANSIV